MLKASNVCLVQTGPPVSDKKRRLQQERLEKRRKWRLENRKKPKQEIRQATVDEYKRTLQGTLFKGFTPLRLSQLI